MHAQRNVSNRSGAIPNINTTRILEREANWRPKNDHTHSLIPLCTYLYVFMPHGMQGSEEPRDQRNLARPSPAVRKSERGRGWLRETKSDQHATVHCKQPRATSPPSYGTTSRRLASRTSAIYRKEVLD